MKNFLFVLLILLSLPIIAQNNVGIGTNTPHNSAKLDISDSTKGILIPRMNSIQRNAIVSPANGLLVYDNDSLAFMYFNGSIWKKIITSFSFTETDPQVSSTSNNQVPKWNGTSLVDGIITDDGTKLGIGTTTPDIDTKVDILSDKPAGIRLLSGNSANTTYFTFGRITQEGVLGTASHPNNYVTGSQAGDIVLREENSANAVIINSGYGNADLIVKGDNVGIGTVSPSNTLDVAGTTETDLFKMNTGAGAGKILQSDASGNASWVSFDTTKGSTLDKAYDFGGRGNGRIIIADSGAVRINGQDGFIVTGTLGTGDIIETTGAGTRMFFNPNKGAFRSGTVNSSYWDHSLIGQNSFATGNNTTAQGSNSFSFGNQTYSSGDNSIAGGFNSTATNNNSIAIGYSTTSSGNSSIALGESVIASGDYSIAMGRSNSASNTYTTNLGGISNTASGLGSTNIGGQGNHSTSFMSVTMGEFNTASGGRSMATNYSNIASGENSSSMGYSNTAKSSGEMVVGIGATNYTPSINGNAFFQAANANDRLFVIGNAIDSNANNQVDINERSNAFVVLKNGNTAIGNITPTSKLDVNGKTKTIDFQMTNGAGINKILQSDASGNASWVNPPSNTDTDSQSLSLSGNNLTISRGNTLDMSPLTLNTWKTTGNTGTNAATNYIGTTDSVDLVFKNNNNQNMRLFANGSWLLGDSMEGTGRKTFFNSEFGAFRIGNLDTTYRNRWNNDSLGINSFATGENSNAIGYNSVAMGELCLAKGSNSFATGFNSHATGNNSIVLGGFSTSSGSYSFAAGYDAYSTGLGSVSMGFSTRANGLGSTAIGFSNNAGNNYSTCIGYSNQSIGVSSVSIGRSNMASDFSTTIGYQNRANSQYSTALGNTNETNGQSSTVFGMQNKTFSFGETVIGIGATNYTTTAGGSLSFRSPNSADRLFVIGNAIDLNSNNLVDSTERSNAMVVLKNGNTAIGNITPTSKLDVDGKTKTINFQMTNTAGANRYLKSDALGNATWDSITANEVNAWGISGNTGTNATSNFIGTTDNVDLVFKNNNNQNMRLFANGTWLVGDTIQGLGSKTFFDITNGAFRTGSIVGSTPRLWDKDSLGINSFATGLNTKAKGFTAIAMGDGSQSYGTTAIAMGVSTIANANSSIAMGQFTIANGLVSTAIGNTTRANGANATAMGIATEANAVNSTSLGNSTKANGFSSLVVGQFNDTILAPQTFMTATTPLFIVGNGTSSTIRRNALVVRNDGNVAIGNISPTSKLDVDGKTKTIDFQMTNGAGANRYLKSDALGNASWDSITANEVYAWGLTGNSGTNANTHFIGTTNSVDLVFKTNNNQSMRLLANGSWLLGDSIQGPGDKTFFDTYKAAFRTGNVSGGAIRFWDRDSLGQYSFATGRNTMAKGDESIAMGVLAKAYGNTSTAIGWQSEAIGIISTAIGFYPRATGDYSTAMGHYTDANGENSTAMGFSSIANGFSSFVIGQYNDTIITPQTAITSNTPLFIIGNGVSHTNRKNAVVVQNDGDFGINNNNPLRKLHILGDGGKSSATAATDAEFVLEEAGDDLYMSILTDTNQESGYQFGNQFNGAHAGIYYNSGGNTYDMRFRVNGNSTKMTIDKDGQVGIGTAIPNSDLETTGSFATAIHTTTSSITLDENHHTVILTGGIPAVTLPAASTCARRIYVIVNQTGGSRSISSYISFTGVATTSIFSATSITIQSDGTNWYRIQ